MILAGLAVFYTLSQRSATYSGNPQDQVYLYVESCLQETLNSGIDKGLSSESAIAIYVDSNIKDCIDNNLFESRGIQVSFGEPETSVVFGQDKVIAQLKMGVEVVTRGQRSTRSEFRQEVPRKDINSGG